VKYLIVPTQHFSGSLKGQNYTSFSDLPSTVRMFVTYCKSRIFAVLDECFVAGTMVDVLSSSNSLTTKPIETILPGDKIINAAGEDNVIAVNSKKVEALVEVCTSGNTTVCSENHRFFTLYGWKSAKYLRAGDYIVSTAEAVCLLRNDFLGKEPYPKVGAFLRKKLLVEMANDPAGNPSHNILGCHGTAHIRKFEAVLQGRVRNITKDARAHTGSEPDVRSKACRENDGDQGSKRHTPCLPSVAGRQWETYTRASTAIIHRAWEWLDNRIRRAAWDTSAWVSNKLQTGFGERGFTGWYRGRWAESLQQETYRQKERFETGFIRVDSVTVYKRGSTFLDKYRNAEGSIYCYDIKAARHQSFSVNGMLVHNCSWIKTTQAMNEDKKSQRTRLIKTLSQYTESRAILTGTLKSKSPMNVIDQYKFLDPSLFPESMYEFAEHYCIMVSLRTARGRRVIISQKDYAAVRKRMVNANRLGGDMQLEAAMCRITNEYGINEKKLRHIMEHRNYTPFLNQGELMSRVKDFTMTVERKDVFDISYDKYIYEPIKESVELSKSAKKLANELVELGFTDSLVLGKAPALELVMRLQDICNGFEPIKTRTTKVKKGVEVDVDVVTYRALKENPKLDALEARLDQIDTEQNQVVIFCARTNAFDSIAERLETLGLSYVHYSGAETYPEKLAAQEKYERGEARVFLANQASAAYGLNCMGHCNYVIEYCNDASVERHHQAQHRVLRGQSTSPKFAYQIYVKGSVEERVIGALNVGQELISSSNPKGLFIFE
jgi:hypothetical protein